MSEPFVMIDLGGTNIRIRIREGRKSSDVVTYKTSLFPNIFEALKTYEAEANLTVWPSRMILGVPTPVNGDTIHLINSSWTFSLNDLRRHLGLISLKVVNDFEAQAMAIPFLGKSDIEQIGAGVVDPNAPKGILGPGTGLGTGFIVPDDQAWKAYATEGGHVTIPVLTEKEFQIVDYLARDHVHISAERLISGQGLANIYRALEHLDGGIETGKTAEEIMSLALAGDVLAREAAMQMFSWLGVVAGNMALTLGAFGGIYISGGIIRQPGVLNLFKKSDFRKMFESKGRREAYMKRIPTFVITAHHTVFMGLERMMEE